MSNQISFHGDEYRLFYRKPNDPKHNLIGVKGLAIRFDKMEIKDGDLQLYRDGNRLGSLRGRDMPPELLTEVVEWEDN